MGLVDYCGKGANIEYGCVFNEGGRGVRIGNYAGIGIRAQIGPYVSIGDFTMMGPDVIILTRNHRFSDINKPMCLQSYLDYKPVIIEDDVWIGQRVIILPGVTIGKGSILGAGAVIAKSIPQYSIVVGNPAQVIKSRLHAIE